MSFLAIVLTYTFFGNIVFFQLLGLCPLLIATERRSTAFIGSLAVVFVSSLSALAAWLVQHVVLLPLGIGYFQTVSFVMTLYGIVRLTEALARAASPGLHAALATSYPLLMPNCAVFGIALIATRGGYSALESLAAGVAAGLGFLIAAFLITAVRERLATEWVPRAFRGLPIALISAGLIAMAFLAFDQGLLKALAG
jgi:Na+-translocating ferredoxin:NAD+ oxidoreductase subunit A